MYTIEPQKLQRLEKISWHIEDHRQEIKALEKEKTKIFEWFQSNFEEVLSEVRNGYEDIICDLKIDHDKLLLNKEETQFKKDISDIEKTIG